MNPGDSVLAAFDQRAQAYHDRFMHLTLYDSTYDRFLQMLGKPDAEVLEVGCGPGNITHALLRRSPSLQVLGVDFSPRMVELARTCNPAARFEVMDARHIRQLGAVFDGILCGFVTPYLDKAEAAGLIRDCAAMLAPGGVLYVSTIEGDPAQSGPHRTSDGTQEFNLYYYSQRCVEWAFDKCRIGGLQLMRVEMEVQDPRQRVHLVAMGRKG